MAYSDRELLARLIQCEAGGEGDIGMKAVAGVVMNRVHAVGGEYARVGQGSIRNIISTLFPYTTLFRSPALPIRLRERNRRRRLQSSEYLQYAARSHSLRNR